MKFRELTWRQYNNEYRADIKVKGLFGIRFIYGQNYGLNSSYFYKWIINGKRYGDSLGLPCNSLNEGKKKCEEQYGKICDQIYDNLFG
jgi:hypothetical protein